MSFHTMAHSLNLPPKAKNNMTIPGEMLCRLRLTQTKTTLIRLYNSTSGFWLILWQGFTLKMDLSHYKHYIPCKMPCEILPTQHLANSDNRQPTKCIKETEVIKTELEGQWITGWFCFVNWMFRAWNIWIHQRRCGQFISMRSSQWQGG